MIPQKNKSHKIKIINPWIRVYYTPKITSEKDKAQDSFGKLNYNDGMLMQNFKKIVERTRLFILDIMFPVNCLGCSLGDDWICEKCFNKIVAEKQEQVCPVCENSPTPNGRTCFKCRNKNSLDGLLVCSSYKNPIISKIIHSFKYKFVCDLHVVLGRIMTENLLHSSLALPDIIIPVPLHKKRLRWRGFNQSGLLAEYISTNLTPGFPICTDGVTLIRNRNTYSQMKIKNSAYRSKNISGAFSVSNRKILVGKSVLLVDDVATTGSTILECAKILKGAGAANVFAIVIARQEMKKND